MMFSFEFTKDSALEDILGSWTVETYLYRFYWQSPDLIYMVTPDYTAMIDPDCEALMLA